MLVVMARTAKQRASTHSAAEISQRSLTFRVRGVVTKGAPKALPSMTMVRFAPKAARETFSSWVQGV